jgi:precorrin-3B C17-methyltransferase
LRETIEAERICGVARNTGRDGESFKITSLEKLDSEKIDMLTTVFIGNSRTKNINGKMVTPRGYL